jgi:radical SAM superfamily enzyme YgiQ (UPF0313 family)
MGPSILREEIMYRVALVSPPYGDGGKSIRPLGLMAIHSFLSERFGDAIEVQLLDYSDCPRDDHHLLDEDGVAAFDVVGLCAYSTNFPIVRDWALELKRRNPKVKTVVGGPHPTALPIHIADKHRDAFDFVVRGEGERPMAAIVEALMTGGRLPRVPGVVYRDALGLVAIGTTDPVPDLNTVPPPLAPVRSPYSREMEYVDWKDGRKRNAVAMTTSRGCPFACTFCSIRASDSKWRAVGAARLGDWVAAAREQDPTVEHVYFMDADFLIDKKRVVAIGEMFASRHPGVTWSFSARVDDLARLGEPALARLAKQGLRFVEIGFESGSQAMLDLLGKHVSVKENYDAVAMLRRLDLDMLIDFILFVPDETPEQLRESVTFLREAGLSEYMPFDHLFTSLFQYPGTPLRVHYEKIFGEFSLDELPEPDELFVHPGTKRIFKHFMRDFAPIAGRVKGLSTTVEEAAERLARSRRDVAQVLRIEAVSLRHIPLLVLEQLIDNPEADSLFDAVPWLRNFEDHAARLEELCKTPHAMAA